MTNYQVGLLTTFLLGIFILIGAGISLIVSKRDKIIDFSIGLAFGVITTLIITDLLPEVFESFGWKYCYIMILFTLVGFFLLRLLDYFVPDHHDHHSQHAHHHLNKKESIENLTHIGMITTLALLIHNIIEGMAVYSSALSSGSLAVSLAIGVGFHNIPLGMVIASSFYHNEKDKKKTLLSIALVSLSTFMGGLFMYLFHLTEISEFILGIFLSLTLGMLLFIVIDELFPRIKDMKDRRMAYIGVTVGILILIIAFFIG